MLDAAAEIIGDVGLADATTNAIAKQAGASPGTLYQFFKNKEEIATALLKRYITILGDAHGSAFTDDIAPLPLRDMVASITDPMIDFDREHPAFYALQAAPEFSKQTAEAKRPLQEAMLERIDSILYLRNPHMETSERHRHGVVAVHIFRGLLPLVMSASESELPAIREAVKDALEAYLSKHF